MLRKLSYLSLVLGIATAVSAQSVKITPDNGNRGQSLPVVISGQNTNFSNQGSNTNIYLKQGSYVLGQGSQTAFTNISVIDPSTIFANLHIPGNAPLGKYDLFVYAGTVTTAQNAFTVNQATNSNITLNPNGSKPGQTVNVTITVPGGSFKKTQVQKIEKVWLNNGISLITDVKNITVVNSSTFTADIVVPVGAVQGMYDASIFTDDGVIYNSAAAFEVSQTFGSAELELLTFDLYPNPVDDILSVQFDGSRVSNVEIGIMDLTGRDVTPAGGLFQKEDGLLRVDLSKLSKGVYMVAIIADGKLVSTKKLLVE